MHEKDIQGHNVNKWLLKSKKIRITTIILFFGILCVHTFQVTINQGYEQFIWRTKKGHYP